MVKILSVDDEADLELLLTQFFRRKIRKGEYEFLFAHNGLEALQLLLKNPDIDIILSDINMPEMDGLTMLAKVNELRNPALKCIMVSAYGDMGNIRQAMNNGAFDFATKPIDLDDLQRTIDKAVEQIEYVKQSQAEHAELQDLHGDLSVAREIQHAILPQHFNVKVNDNDKLDIFASMQAAKDVGGDFYDFFRIDDTHMGFTIADVSGKGVPAALFMAVSRTVIKATALRGLPASQCVEIANNMLCEENVENMFVTAFYGIMDTTTGTIDYTNAGHNPPYVLHADGTVTMLPSQGNMPLGCFAEVPFKSAIVKLMTGDMLVMFTDGVTEAMNAENEGFGENRLENLLPSLSEKSCEEAVGMVNQTVKEFVGDAPQSDDITLLAIKKM